MKKGLETKDIYKRKRRKPQIAPKRNMKLRQI
jgi:hypothetical protein